MVWNKTPHHHIIFFNFFSYHGFMDFIVFTTCRDKITCYGNNNNNKIKFPVLSNNKLKSLTIMYMFIYYVYTRYIDAFIKV